MQKGRNVNIDIRLGDWILRNTIQQETKQKMAIKFVWLSLFSVGQTSTRVQRVESSQVEIQYKSNITE